MPDNTLTPQSWEAFVGQEKLKRRLQIKIDAALERMEPLGHILFHSSPGAGKSSIGMLIAQQLGVGFTTVDMPIKIKALNKLLMETDGVLMLDETHRLKKSDQENLLPVLWKGIVQFDNGKQVKLPPRVTIIGATTEIQSIIKPLRDRFHYVAKFDPYTDEDMAKIVTRMATRVDLTPTTEECKALGRASAGTPRQARNLILTARDIGTCDPSQVLETAGITFDGLTEDHTEYLFALDQMGQRAGVDNLSNLTGQPKDMIIELEKLLVLKGLILYTAKGRELTVEGMQKIRLLREGKDGV